MKNFLLALALIIFQTSSFAQTGWQWAVADKSDTLYKGSANARGVVSDASGNTYVLGEVINGDIWLGNKRLSQSLGRTFVAKYSSSGNLLWAKQYGDGNARPASIAVCKSGGVYIAGNYNADMLVDTIIVYASQGNAFIARLGDDGNVIWAKGDVQMNTIYYYGLLIAADAADNVVLCTRYRDDAIVQSSTLTGYGICIAQYAKNNGAPLKVSSTHTGPSASVTGMAIDSKGNGYITGSFTDSLWIDNAVVFNTNRPAYNGYIYSFDTDLLFNRLKQVDGSGSDLLCSDIACDDKGHIYIAGKASGVVNLGDLSATPATDAKLFVACIDSQLHGVWVNTINTADTVPALNAITVGADGNIAVAGHCNEAIQFGNTPAIPAYDADRIYAAQYSSTGALNWVQTAIGIYSLYVAGISADAHGVLLAGGFRKKVSFNYISLQDSLPLASMFLARIADITGINTPGKSSAQVYPNPFAQNITVTGIEAGTEVQLLDAFGRILSTSVSTVSSLQLNTSTILPGSYWLRIIDNSKNTSTLHLVKQ